MTRPTHVYVGRPIVCTTCAGTGIVPLGFVHGPNGPICPDCRGAKLTYETMTLEEFAAMFTYGQTYRHPYQAPDHEIRVRSERQSDGEGS